MGRIREGENVYNSFFWIEFVGLVLLEKIQKIMKIALRNFWKPPLHCFTHNVEIHF